MNQYSQGAKRIIVCIVHYGLKLNLFSFSLSCILPLAGFAHAEKMKGKRKDNDFFFWGGGLIEIYFLFLGYTVYCTWGEIQLFLYYLW